MANPASFDELIRGVQVNRESRKRIRNKIEQRRDHVVAGIFDKQEVLMTGSAFEGLKVGNADEFDFMVVDATSLLSIRRFIFDPGHLRTPFFESADGDPKAFRSTFTRLARQKGNFVLTRGPGCLMQFKFDGEKITADLIPAMKVELRRDLPIDGRGVEDWQNKVYAIPKVKRSPADQTQQPTWHWRLSFSVLEKEYVRKNTNSAQKQALRIVKYLGIHPGGQRLADANIKSYWLKNAWLQMCDEGWGHVLGDKEPPKDKDQLLQLTMQFLERLREAVDRQQLPCFFLPSVNLLQGQGVRRQDALEALQDIRSTLFRFTRPGEVPSRHWEAELWLMLGDQLSEYVIKDAVQRWVSRQEMVPRGLQQQLIRQAAPPSGGFYRYCMALKDRVPDREDFWLVLQLTRIGPTRCVHVSVSSEPVERRPGA